MRLVDTSLWIEGLIGGNLADQFAALVSPIEECIVPTLVQFELCKWAKRIHSDQKVDDILAFTNECQVVELNSDIARSAALLSIQHQLHATDAIIYATAQVVGAILCTCDAHFKGLPGVEYFEK